MNGTIVTSEAEISTGSAIAETFTTVSPPTAEYVTPDAVAASVSENLSVFATTAGVLWTTMPPADLDNITSANGSIPFLQPCPAGMPFMNASNSTCYPKFSGGGRGAFFNPFDVPHIRAIFIIMYSFVFACCFFGNLLVIFVVLKHRKMRTITNFFLANLAVADFCVGIFCVLPNLSIFLSPVWLLGKVMCKLYYFVQHMSYLASITILTAISIERYIAIIYPVKSKQVTTMCRLRVAVVVTWVIAAVYCVPLLIVYDTVTVKDTINGGFVDFCVLLHPLDIQSYVTSNFVLWYVIPLILITVMYSRISVVLWKTSRADATKLSSKRPKTPKFKSPTDGYRGLQLTAYRKKPNIYDERRKAGQSAGNTHGRNHLDPQSSNVYPSSEAISHVSITSAVSDVRNYECETEEDNISDPGVGYESEWSTTDRKMAKQGGITANGNFRDNRSGIKPNRSDPGLHAHTCTQNVEKKKSSSGVVKMVTTHKHGKDNALTARRKVIRLLIIVIVSFAVCVLPYHVRVLWQNWSGPQTVQIGHYLFSPISFLILYSNSGLNPFLYAFLSDNFRRSMKEVLCCKPRRGETRRSFVSKTSQTNV